MKFTLSWLKEHLDTDASVTEITDTLTAIGLELESVTNPADALRPFRVAKVLEAAPHPNADKLRLLRVDDGSGEPWQVVCGAPNARTGLIGVFGPPGTYVPGSDFTLKPAKIRDVESFGMMCSARELMLGEDHDGIIELPADAPVGASYGDYAGLDDPLIDVAVLPNRPDCMGVRGIARDLAVAGLGTLRPLRQVYRMSDAPLPRSGAGPDIRIEDADGCPAFYACTVSGVRNGTAPEWMQKALKATGQKPISALVDITNFIMLDLGRPLHVYDVAKLNGPLVARKALPGESVTALNDKDYVLDDSMTVIADDEGAHDIGGIMGGARTGASDDTREVLIECAYFTPENIARTGQRLMLSSDARQRFERGVDPAFLDEGLEIATWLVLEHCGGQASAVSRAGIPPVAPRTIGYDPAFCLRLGGVDIANDAQQRILESLGFAVVPPPLEGRGPGGGDSPERSGLADSPHPNPSPEGEGLWAITIPTNRRDIDGPADLVEEIVRIHGIDAVPSTPLPRVPGVARAVASPMQRTERKLRRAAAARGLNECVTWSFLSEREAAALGGGDWRLANPISEELKVMRPSLLPGLIAAAQRNHDRGATSIRLFEIGRRYRADGERLTLGFLLAGERTERGWQEGAASRFTAHDAKAEVLALLSAAGAPADRLMDFGPDEAASGRAYHPGQAGTLRLGPKNILASFGSLHPLIAKTMGLKAPAVAGEIYLDAVPMKPISDHRRPAFAPSALQAVTRDFAFILDESVAAADLVRAVKGADKALIVAARVFDRFAGDTLGEGKVSLAVEVTLQPKDTSLTEADLQALSGKIVAAAAKLGASLRG